VTSSGLGLKRKSGISHSRGEKTTSKYNVLKTTLKMPGEVIDRPNPEPLASHVPDSVLELSVKLERLHINENDIQALQDFRRASNYIAAGK
jgi:hypothetical protein